MIDTHCHFDMMPNPEHYIREKEKRGDIVIGMTNAPSHFQIGYLHVRYFKHIRLALGFHPLLAHELQDELPMFEELVNKTSYIGEIGLDFSKEGIQTKEIQIASLKKILSILKGKSKIISVHSRNAEETLLSLLREYQTKNVIFHWYTGNISLIPKILAEGYYFSINESMTLTQKGQKIIAQIPKDRILTETDNPFNKKSDLSSVYAYLKTKDFSEQNIYKNFKIMLSRLSCDMPADKKY